MVLGRKEGSDVCGQAAVIDDAKIYTGKPIDNLDAAGENMI